MPPETTGVIKGDASQFIAAIQQAQTALSALQAQGRLGVVTATPNITGLATTINQAATQMQSLATLANQAAGSITAIPRAANQATTAINATATATRNAANAASSASTAFGTFGRTVKSILTGILVYRGISLFGNFLEEAGTLTLALERGQAEIATLADVGKEQVDQLTVSAAKLGAAFGFDLQDSIRATYQAISAGVKPAESLEILEQAAILARAGLGGMRETTDALLTVVNSYNLSTKQAAIVSDVLFTTVKDGRITLPELAKGLSRVQSQAASLGVDLVDLTAFISAITKGSLRSAEAFTGAAQAFKSIQKPTEEAREAAKLLGIQFDSSAVRIKGFGGFIKDLTAALHRASEAGFDQNLILAELFGNQRALKAITPAVSDQYKSFTKALVDHNFSLGNAAKGSKVLADTYGQTLKVAIDEAKIALANFGVDTLKTLDELIKKAKEFNIAFGGAFNLRIEGGQQKTLLDALSAAGSAAKAGGSLVTNLVGAGSAKLFGNDDRARRNLEDLADTLFNTKAEIDDVIGTGTFKRLKQEADNGSEAAQALVRAIKISLVPDLKDYDESIKALTKAQEEQAMSAIAASERTRREVGFASSDERQATLASLQAAKEKAEFAAARTSAAAEAFSRRANQTTSAYLAETAQFETDARNFVKRQQMMLRELEVGAAIPGSASESEILAARAARLQAEREQEAFAILKTLGDGTSAAVKAAGALGGAKAALGEKPAEQRATEDFFRNTNTINNSAQDLFSTIEDNLRQLRYAIGQTGDSTGTLSDLLARQGEVYDQVNAIVRNTKPTQQDVQRLSDAVAETAKISDRISGSISDASDRYVSAVEEQSRRAAKRAQQTGEQFATDVFDALIAPFSTQNQLAARRRKAAQQAFNDFFLTQGQAQNLFSARNAGVLLPSAGGAPAAPNALADEFQKQIFAVGFALNESQEAANALAAAERFASEEAKSLSAEFGGFAERVALGEVTVGDFSDELFNGQQALQDLQEETIRSAEAASQLSDSFRITGQLNLEAAQAIFQRTYAEKKATEFAEEQQRKAEDAARRAAQAEVTAPNRIFNIRDFDLSTRQGQAAARSSFIASEQANREAARRLGAPLGSEDLLNLGVLFDKLLREAGVSEIFRFAGGGTVPGSGTSDNVAALLTPGEEVVDRERAPLVRAILAALENGTGGGLNLTVTVNVQDGGGSPSQLGRDIGDATLRRLMQLLQDGQLGQLRGA